MRGNMEDVMKYYEKQNGEETFVMAVDENGNYSVASNLDSEPDGFTAPADPLGQGYKECSQQRAEEILGYSLEDESIHVAELGQHPQHISIQDAVECEKCNPYGLTEKQYRTILDQGGDPSQQEEQVS